MTDKRFDGWLICSDIDGTLTDNKGSLSSENAEAIRHFQQLGGLFTVATGRYPEYIKKYAPLFSPNTFVVGLNGAVVSELETGNEKWFADMPEGSLADVELIFAACPQLECVLVNMQQGCIEIPRNEPEKLHSVRVTHENKLFKLVFTSPEPISEETRGFFLALAKGKYLCEQSWKFGIELYGRGAGKHNAVRWLKNAVGAEKLVCVGDYENDIGMIRLADVGVAVGNAHEAVRAAADYISSSNEDSAIADVMKVLINSSFLLPD